MAAFLGERDRAVLADLADHRFLTSGQLQRLRFADHASESASARTGNRVLRRLEGGGLVRQLPRRVGGFASGSAQAVWYLTTTGYRLLALAEADSPGTKRTREPSPRTVEHCLAVADVRVSLETAAHRGDFHLAAVQTEPRCWRRFTGRLGTTETLKPDLGAVTYSADGRYEDRWFLEIDLGSEHPPTVVRQCQAYESYRRSGSEQHRHTVFPLVVWLTRTAARAERLRSAIREARSLDRDLFRVVTAAEIAGLVASGRGGEL